MNRLVTTNQASNGSHPENGLGLAAVITIAVIVSMLGAYYQTAWSMVMTWHRSDTYAHGFL
ncbi:MAG: exosortase A, partial [Pseudomonadota bacterium]